MYFLSDMMVGYVGHILVVSKQGIETDPEKTNIILKWLIPTTLEKVRKCLGFIGVTANSSETSTRSQDLYQR